MPSSSSKLSSTILASKGDNGPPLRYAGSARRVFWRFCSSARRFATGFLQTRPHGHALAFR
ncbi:MAG: hypothetical protein GF353_06520 [Candidatus Lokiarchaeota archaeon]|nr:hypothetical protein [Candidatus Lokiarchaeota archaeon]